MQPNFGSIIWNIMFEPLTEEIRSIIVQDVKKVVSYDPRTQVDHVLVTQFDYGLHIEVELSYIPTNQTETVIFNFDSNTQTLTTG